MTDTINIVTHEEIASKGGKTRATNLSPERRREIAQMGVVSRKCYKDLPKATHDGVLEIGGALLSCAVLKDGTRVISLNSLRKAMGIAPPNSREKKLMKEGQGGYFLMSSSLSQYYEKVFGGEGRSIRYLGKDGTIQDGFNAIIVPEICNIYLEARRDGKLLHQQFGVAAKAEVLLFSFSKIGIVSLIDEITGYQQERARDELQTLLKTFISADLLKWARRFPHDFFQEIYRLYGWEYKPGKFRHPSCLGNFINKYIYEAISPEVLEELRTKNPVIDDKKTRAACHHQFLTPDVGLPALDKHLMKTLSLLQVSTSIQEFDILFSRLPIRRNLEDEDAKSIIKQESKDKIE